MRWLLAGGPGILLTVYRDAVDALNNSHGDTNTQHHNITEITAHRYRGHQDIYQKAKEEFRCHSLTRLIGQQVYNADCLH